MQMVFCICAVIFSVALYTDIRWRRVPNFITVPAVFSGVCYHMLAAGPSSGFLFSLNGFFTGCALLIVPFILGGSGGGDVKLLGAVGAWLGAETVFCVFLYGAITGGVISLTFIFSLEGINGVKMIRGIIIAFFHKEKVMKNHMKDQSIPYTVPMAMGYLYYLVFGKMF